MTDPCHIAVDPVETRAGIDLRYLILFVAGLMVIRITGLFNIYFWEGDEISLAAGVAALVRDNIGDAYRYTQQIGYYRLIELIGSTHEPHVF